MHSVCCIHKVKTPFTSSYLVSQQYVCVVPCPCSIFGAIRTGSYMMYILMTKGLKQSVCDQSFYNGPVSKFWAYAFVLSKAPELGKFVLFVPIQLMLLLCFIEFFA